MNYRLAKLVWVMVAGGLFGAGLVISGMSNPNKVLNFLDVMGPWDPSLLLVMGGASVVVFVGYRVVLRRSAPFCAEAFHVPANRTIDRKLLLGSALFGLGWGMAGYCPGPALTALVIVPSEALVFVAAMLAGMLLKRALFDR